MYSGNHSNQDTICQDLSVLNSEMTSFQRMLSISLIDKSVCLLR